MKSLDKTMHEYEECCDLVYKYQYKNQNGNDSMVFIYKYRKKKNIKTIIIGAVDLKVGLRFFFHTFFGHQFQ